MGFPQFGNIDKVLIDTIKGRAGNNKRVSRYMPWIRVISCLEGFLVLESSKEATSFVEKKPKLFTCVLDDDRSD